MPEHLTPEQIQRHQRQLEEGHQRSVERMGTQITSLYDDQLSETDTTPFFLKSVPYLKTVPAPADLLSMEEYKESRSEKKKRASMEKQYRKAREAERLADRKEGSEKTRAFRSVRRNSDVLEKGEYKREQSVLDRRLAAIEEQEKADLLAVDLSVLQKKNAPATGEITPENSAEAKRLEARWNAQKARVEAYHVMAAQMPLGSKEREKLMEKKEEEVLKAGRLKREYSVACMPEGTEKSREAATIKRHAKFDVLKRMFRKPSPYSREDAAVTLENGKTLVNAGRATLGGTKAMYVFEETLEDGSKQEWLFKEATNCVGMSKPEGAVVTGAASGLQQYLRGDLSIPAQCLKDEQGKVVGSIQKRVQKADGGVDLFKWQAQGDLRENMPPKTTLDDLMNEHTLDWILCNFDTKGENFINQENGHIISFDKEASFNTLLQEESREMSYTFKPHSNDTIYNTMFRAYAEGKISLDLDANLESIQKLEQMSGDDFIAMFRETLDTKYGTGTEDRAEAERVLRARHRNLRETYRRFYTQLIKERIDNLRSNTEENREERERLDGLLIEGTFVFADEQEKQ